MSSCCTRKRSKKDLLFLPMAGLFTVFGFITLLAIEMSIAYGLGLI